MTGYYAVSRNICDFVCYKYPNMYYIESKATWKDRFDFSMLTDTQYDGLYKKSKIDGCFGLVVVLFASYQKAFILDIRDIDRLSKAGKKSLNIKKHKNWEIPSAQIQTVASRKQLLDYNGDLQGYVKSIVELQSSWEYKS